MYSHTINIKRVVDFSTKTAEIAISFDAYEPTAEHFQKVISANCPTIDDAELVSSQYSDDLFEQVKQFIIERTSNLQTAKE